MAHKRETGFYWCKFVGSDEWHLLHYINDDTPCNDHLFSVINETRIKSPDEKVEMDICEICGEETPVICSKCFKV